jgi:hypothetical protein
MPVRRIRLLALVALPVIGALAGPASAQTDARFGTREPMACGDPVRSKPNEQQIKDLIRCKKENVTREYVTLIEDIKVETGGMRAYNQFSDGYATSIDTAEKVMPIRGSLTSYQCNPLTTVKKSVYDVVNVGKNCLVVKQQHAEGKCFKTTFGDWWCGMQENVPSSNFEHDQPPPARH